ncbi:MAG: chitobiase/beta-hexosaminidase C-terminal domain-containing protein [Spirochaetia bacterium]
MSARTLILLSTVVLGFLGGVTSCSNPDANTPTSISSSTSSANPASSETTTQQAAALTFSPPAGSYTTLQTVTISATTAGASIRYTTDGSAPTETVGTLYAGPVRVETSLTIRAVSYVAGAAGSNTASAAYSIGAMAATPSFLPAGGTYSSDQSVTISAATPGAVIHYTTDGSTPTSSSADYAAPIPVAGNGTNETIKAIATATGMTASSVGAATYIIAYGKGASPEFSPAAGTYPRDQSVVISCSLPGSVIHYTTDGSTPTGSSAAYTAPIAVAGNGTAVTIKAIASAPGTTASSVVTATYAISYGWQTVGALGSGAGQLKYPAGVIVDAQGRLYVVDQGNSRIVRVNDMDGTGWTVLDGAEHGVNRFKSPAGAAVDAEGRIYVADQGNSRIVRVNDMSGAGWIAFGSFGSGTGQFITPAGIAVDAQGRIYVADQGNSRIVRMDDMDGAGWAEFGRQGSEANRFKYPAGVALDARGRIYVADYANSRVVRMDDMKGTNWTTLGSAGASARQLKYPAGIALDTVGHICIADMINERIVRMDDMDGANWTTLGGAGNQFDHPRGIAVDAAGRIYVADMLDDRVVRLIMP